MPTPISDQHMPTHPASSPLELSPADHPSPSPSNLKVDLAPPPPASTADIDVAFRPDVKPSHVQHHQQQQARWAQGCQAIFAGFVASAHIQHLQPTISAFGGTPQYDIILSTLTCIAEVAAHAGAGAAMKGWKETLDGVLRRDDNKYTRPVTPAPRTQGDEEMRWDEAWCLTSRGRQLFHPRLDGQVATPLQAVPKWWNM